MIKTSSKKPVVVFSINHFGLGGAQRQLIRLLPQLTDSFEVHVFILQAPVGGHSFVEELPSEIVIHQFSFSRLWLPLQWYAVYQVLANLKPAVVVSSLFMSNTVLRILGRLKRIPIIVREHNTTVNRRFHHCVIERLLAMNSEPIVAVSKEVADEVSKSLNISRKKYIVIPNGIDLQEIQNKKYTESQNTLKSTLGIAASDRILLSVGRCVRQKRLDVLIAGYGAFAQECDGWHVVIVGDGSEKESLETQVAQLGLQEKVHFLGAQPSTHEFYHIADALVSTSEQEGMSNVHLEALAHGVPIITTRTGGTSAIVVPRETGLFIEESEAQAVCAQLCVFAKDNETDWRENCRQHSLSFSIEKTAREYGSLLSKIIGR